MEISLRDLVMDAIADDYEKFEIICGEVRQQLPNATDPEIQDALTSLVAEGLAYAYELGGSVNMKVRFDVSRLHELWYQLSRAGIDYVQSHPYN